MCCYKITNFCHNSHAEQSTISFDKFHHLWCKRKQQWSKQWIDSNSLNWYLFVPIIICNKSIFMWNSPWLAQISFHKPWFVRKLKYKKNFPWYLPSFGFDLTETTCSADFKNFCNQLTSMESRLDVFSSCYESPYLPI